MKDAKPRTLSLREQHGDLPTLIASKIGRSILNQELLPGQQLPPETDFLAETGVSRTTMREAVKLLVSRGLVDAKQKIGTRVRPSSDWNLLDPTVLTWLFDTNENLHDLILLFEIRRLIEPEAAAFAASRGTPERLDQIGERYAELERASSTGEGLIAADVAFHMSILRAAENKFLSSLGTVIDTVITTTSRVSVRRPGGLPHSLPSHFAVFDAIRSRHPEVAKAQMWTLINDAQNDVKMILEERSAASSRGDRSRLNKGPKDTR